MTWFKKARIFLDSAGGRSNPSGIHQEGREARKRLNEARERVARVLRCQARDIVFTSGGTESDNLAILGVYSRVSPESHIVISNLEHPAVLESAREAKRRGARLSILPKEEILKNISDDTVLVSTAFASSETGELNGVAKLAREIRELRKQSGKKTPYIHCDASQAYGLLPIDIERLGVDLLTIDNILVARANVDIGPIIFGGGQERGLRSGTEDVEKIISTANYLESLVKTRDRIRERVSGLKETFIKELEENLPQVVINTPKDSLPNIVSISIPGVLHEFVAIKLDELGVAVSTGSSCDSMKDEKDKEMIRLSFDEKNTEREVKKIIRILQSIVV